ncbi:hypothetical protein [Microvirga alba]|uniref:Uncharacterized protein n=1 Tax=Microvirga alba TaxID=2791025 RepID=A0A931BZL6_9HYPH|nr:hypothetical protein [Microvirga alba]MBF9235727.1 hypothetical protein [Microvirga alba]
MSSLPNAKDIGSLAADDLTDKLSAMTRAAADLLDGGALAGKVRIAALVSSRRK